MRTRAYSRCVFIYISVKERKDENALGHCNSERPFFLLKYIAGTLYG